MTPKSSPTRLCCSVWCAIALAALAGCSSRKDPGSPEVKAEPSAAQVSPAPAPAPVVPKATAPASAPAPAATPAPAVEAKVVQPKDIVPPVPVKFEESIARAGAQLLAQAAAQLGTEPRTLVIDPLIDANTGAQTQSTVSMGQQLEGLVKTQHKNLALQPLTRVALAQEPLLMIGTLTPVNVERAIDTVPDAFRVWLTLIDLRTGRVVAKQLDRATVESVNAEPLKFYSDSPTWHKDKTVLGYINSCQINTRIGDPADPEYLAALPAAAIVNEATMAYDDGKLPEAQKLYKAAAGLAYPDDLRVLNGLYLTSWRLGQKEVAKDAFDKLVASGLEAKRLPVKLLFVPGKTVFNQVGDLPQQYQVWIDSLAQQADKAQVCVRLVGHTSRTGSAGVNERLSRQRAEAVQKLLERQNRTLGARLSAAGVGSREALVGLGTDDQRDALDRRVEFRVVDCV